MNKAILIGLLIASCEVAADVSITPNIPGLNVRDYTARSVTVTPDGQVYESLPGLPGVRDYTRRGYYLDDGELIPEAVPGVRARDYMEPSYSIEEQ